MGISPILCLAHLRADLTPALVCVMQPLAGHPRRVAISALRHDQSF